MGKYESFENINAFQMDISYLELNSTSPQNVHDHHIHDECEIYINLSGDVSFMVENYFYPIVPGSVIITRPYEYHHCIYHSDRLHKHFWILFQPAHNKKLLDIFYNRELGKNNLRLLEPQECNEMIQVCHKLDAGVESDVDKYFYFFQLLRLLNNARIFNEIYDIDSACVIAPAIDYISNNFAAKISVKELAGSCNISVSTLERYFLNMFNLTPLEYIKKKRLANAIKMLSEGYSITDIAYYSGFSDCSSFITAFKKEYNITPLQYKKNCT